MVMYDHLQADVVVKVKSIITEVKNFIVQKVSKSIGKMKGNTSVFDNNIVFKVMQQVCIETQKMELSKVFNYTV